MEGMTDYQFKSILKMVAQIIEKSEDKDEALRKITELLEDK